MPSNKYALIRYRIIDQMISKGHYPNKEELRAACEDALYGSTDNMRISSSTIDKDISALRNEEEFGYAPIEFHKQYRGYYYSDPEFRFTDALSSAEIDLIKISASVLHHFKGSDLLKELETTIERISNKVRLTRKAKEEIENYIQFESAPLVGGTEFLDPILNAIRSQNKICFTYKKFAGVEVKQYTFRPYLLKEYRNRWYLIGYFSNGGDVTIFGLDRINSVVILEDKFERNKSFKPDEIFKHSIGITIDNSEPFEIILSINLEEAKYIKSLPLHHSQTILSEDEEYVILSLFVNDSYELESIIMGLGNQVTVIEPEFFRNRIIQLHKESIKNYK
jgi:predicted DNA-binding transcriptional regulator YafY